MRRIDGQRRQHRKYVSQEDDFGGEPVAGGDILGVQKAQAVVVELATNLKPDALLVIHQAIGLSVDLAQLLGRGEAVLAEHAYAFAHLASEPGDADHVEFIQIAGRNRQKTEPFQKWVAPIAGFLEHQAIEGQPGELAVYEPLGRVPQHASGGRSRRGSGPKQKRSGERHGFEFRERSGGVLRHVKRTMNSLAG